jgi:hypothetical protein
MAVRSSSLASCERTHVRTDDQRERRLKYELTEITPRIADGELFIRRSRIKRSMFATPPERDPWIEKVKER